MPDTTLTLESTDPFEAVLIDMVRTNRAKRADYAHDDDMFSNFRMSGAAVGIAPLKVVDTLIAVKNARILALESNGRQPANESVQDTYLDRAVYSVIALALVNESACDNPVPF